MVKQHKQEENVVTEKLYVMLKIDDHLTRQVFPRMFGLLKSVKGIFLLEIIIIIIIINSKLFVSITFCSSLEV